MNAGLDLPIRSAFIGASAILGKVFFFLMLHLVTGSGGLRLTHMDAPDVVDPRDGLQLDCHFDMGSEELYAVKWYKDDQEFFRYMPRQNPHTLMFPVSGVSVVPHESDCDITRCKVRLHKLSSRYSSGAYRCEISSEAPAFRLAAETHNITVAALPREKPKIDGLASVYAEGDILTAECTSDFAYPIPVLRWYVNGEPAIPVARPTIIEKEVDVLVAQTILLRLVVGGNLIKGTSIQIGCEATVPNVSFGPQLTTVNVPLKTTNADGMASNEKLQLWYSAFNASSSLLISSYHVALSILLYIFVRWIFNN
ncbi:uncharacterized protein LOC114334181 [Diabrotica virgifera virgifera]|uniref:Uncharacterized protein LOC114334181 n=1 Tax=Diabrotica virgifera virgifera TaxID=50390 RepID=A0A6P7FYX8_DIAVI|nr:uncharacterized protein LOC114334181 [Diabrotica virgifera virgifera]XP_028140017.1 uncharacterized protein LOC114334181 [Diabrotica virgifera virgifera]